MRAVPLAVLLVAFSLLAQASYETDAVLQLSEADDVSDGNYGALSTSHAPCFPETCGALRIP